jgi:carbamate kinase
MLVVVALGGNALIRRGERADADVQRRNLETAVAAIAEVAADHDVVVTHGNGPQVGLLALQGEAYKGARPYPLDVLGAETEGMVGYMLEQGLQNALPGRQVATLLTQVVVDAHDPAFARPTKPVGPMYTEAEALALAKERGWDVAADGDGFRRVVPSPEPLSVVELRVVSLLLAAGVLVVCAGGGGIPVVPARHGGLRGVEAVIDKDLAASLLARLLHADALLILTDVDHVVRDHGTPAAMPLSHVTAAELREMRFAAGSMAPKVEAACRFVESGAGFAAIGALGEAAAMLDQNAGTVVTAAPLREPVRLS